jgi:hypothetical protein
MAGAAAEVAGFWSLDSPARRRPQAVSNCVTLCMDAGTRIDAGYARPPQDPVKGGCFEQL